MHKSVDYFSFIITLVRYFTVMASLWGTFCYFDTSKQCIIIKLQYWAFLPLQTLILFMCVEFCTYFEVKLIVLIDIYPTAL